jgi:uncharacterized membrane protein/cytochrome c2
MLHLHWIEIHAGINHLPFAFLLAVPIFEIGAVLFRKREWRTVSFWLLAAAVVTLFPTLITGWITGDALKITGGAARPPELFVWHRLSAFITAGLASLLLIWRIAVRDELRGKKYVASLALALLTAGVVGATGFMGGRMVLGSGGQSTFIPLQSAAPQVVAKIPDLDPKQIAAGQKLFAELPCQSCHTMNGSGGIAGPNLTHEAQRHNDPAWHIAHLKDPSKMSPDSGMPPFDYLKPDELKALAAYLATRK